MASALAEEAPIRLDRRWTLVLGVVVLQLALGVAYSWTAFVDPLRHEFGWSQAQAMLPFEIAIGTVFLGALIGGRLADRRGSRPVALGGGVLFALGVLLSTAVGASSGVWTLALTFGVLGGLGLGAAYVAPFAMLVKWFPDNRGLVTGIAAGGFGLGAVLATPAASFLLRHASAAYLVFLPVGLVVLVLVPIGARFLRDPEAEYQRAGWEPDWAVAVARSHRSVPLWRALLSPQFHLLTLAFAVNIGAGGVLVAVAHQATREITGASAGAAAVVVFVLILCNAAGRFLWGFASDRVGRLPAAFLMLAIQALTLLLLPHVGALVLFAILAALAQLCFGGGFGVMPATAADFFGTGHAGAVHGGMLLAWSLGGVAGPWIGLAVHDATGGYTWPFTVAGLLALAGSALPLIVKPPSMTEQP